MGQTLFEIFVDSWSHHSKVVASVKMEPALKLMVSHNYHSISLAYQSHCNLSIIYRLLIPFGQVLQTAVVNFTRLIRKQAYFIISY